MKKIEVKANSDIKRRRSASTRLVRRKEVVNLLSWSKGVVTPKRSYILLSFHADTESNPCTEEIVQMRSEWDLFGHFFLGGPIATKDPLPETLYISTSAWLIPARRSATPFFRNAEAPQAIQMSVAVFDWPQNARTKSQCQLMLCYYVATFLDFTALTDTE